MADKEERIEVSTYDLNNKEWNGDIPIDILKVYTRQEAIRKMCDAYFKAKDEGVMESERVEAALNALLQKDK